MRIKVKGQAPKYANEYAAGLDIYNNGKAVIVQPNAWATIQTRLADEIPRGHFGMIVPLSRSDTKNMSQTMVGGV